MLRGAFFMSYANRRQLEDLKPLKKLANQGFFL